MPVIGSLLQDRYRLDAELGRGGMGTVYRGYDTYLDRPVAIKVLNRAGLGSEGRARLLREARAVARLNHPNIVGVYDAGEVETTAEEGTTPFIVMELVEGQSLFERKPESLDEIVAVVQQVCAALEHAHSQGIIHRDLKLENVLVTPDGTAKLMDFGLARSGASRITSEGTIVGTLSYLAPEQALGQKIDGRLDLYALGVMLYELTTGCLPFTGDDPLTIVSQHLHAPVVPPSTLRPDLPPALEPIILKLLAKNPADRFASAREVALALSETTEMDQPQSTSGKPGNNLPIQLSTFVGREREIEEVKQLLSRFRLVTLTGAGGSGKTRLALQVAGDLLATFPDGAWLVELASLSDPALVPQAVVSALDIREQPGRQQMETLSNYLRSRRLLLVLDNCEHLIEACATLVETLLRVCPHLRVLATSREAIGIIGESAWMVPSLSVPNPAQLRHSKEALISTLAEYEAVRLFLDRTAAVQPGFTLTSQNAMPVAQICYQLDGIPLAIELAAARMRALSVEQIAARLDDRFNLLTVGSRTALPRHQTLRATIDWSYELLSGAERALLCRLSVFVNGWRLTAAEAVCTGETIQKNQVLDLLTRLVDKSLVIMEEQEKGVRYRMLETIRQYAQEKLLELEASELVQRRHLHFFLRLAEASEPKLRSAEQVAWLDQLEVEHDNLRAALEWSLSHGETEAALRLAGSVWRFWYLRGYWSEGREWLQRALAKGDSDDVAWARIKVLSGAGWLADESGREGPLYEESLALARVVNDKWATAFALRGLGAMANNQGNRERAVTLLDESLALFREIQDNWGIALALFNRGWVAFEQNDYRRAELTWAESLSLFQQAGDRWGMAVTSGALGLIARFHSDYKRATALSKESLNLFRELGDKAGIAQSLFRLAHVALRRDEFEQAATLFREVMGLQKELGNTLIVAYAFATLGLIACYQGDFQQAANLLDESMALAQEAGDQRGMIQARDTMALVAYYQGDASRAGALWQENLDLLQEQADKGNLALALNGLGRVAHVQGDYQGAVERLEESLALFRQVGEKQNVAVALFTLGIAIYAQGAYSRAAGLFEESLSLRRDIGSKRGVAESLEGLAAVAVAQAQPERAARLFGAAEALREATGAPLPPVEQADYEYSVGVTRDRLGEEAFTAEWHDGGAMSMEQAIAYALGENV